MKKARSDPVHAVLYLLYGKNFDVSKEKERVKFKGTLNCISDDPEEASHEMWDLSSHNLKKSDHFAHFIVSLNAGEHLTEGQWLDVINIHLKALGVSHHQAVFTVHKDTDNEHCHIFLNRVDPQTFKLNRLSFSRKKEQQADLDCEIKYGLKEDPHPLAKQSKTKDKAETRAKDIEAQTAQETLYSYMKRLLPILKTTYSWQNLHTVLAENGIELEKCGRGIIFKARDPMSSENDPKWIAIKGSNLKDSEGSLSLSNLEKKFGIYQKAAFDLDKVISRHIYTGQPVDFNQGTYKTDHSALLENFDLFMQIKHKHSILADKIKFRKEQLLTNRRKADQVLRTVYKNQLKAIYQLYKNKSERDKKIAEAKQSLKKGLANNKSMLEEALKKLDDRLKTFPQDNNFMEYLRSTEADQENIRSLLLSRKHAMEQFEKNFCEMPEILTLQTVSANVILSFCYLAKTTHKGQEIYRSKLNNDWIRDDGFKLMINDHPSINTVKDFLTLSLEKFGQTRAVKIHGLRDFQIMCAVQAAKMNIDIECDEPLVQRFFLRKKSNERSGNDRQQYFKFRRYFKRGAGLAGGVRSARGSIFTAGRLFKTGSIFDNEELRTNGGDRRDQFTDSAQTEIRTQYQASGSERDLHQVPKSNLDDATQTNDVLLHADEQVQLGQSVKQHLSDRMRRKIYPGSRGIEEQPKEKTLQDFLFERNEKHRQGFKDVLPHKLWDGQTGKASYQGVRTIEGKKYVLLLLNEEILVKEVKPALNYLLRKQKKGTLVEIDSHGFVKVQSRSKHR